jgi:hypothetical protein
VFGRRVLDELTVDEVRKLIETMHPTHRPQTVRNVLHTLSRLYEDQPKAMKLTNPCASSTAAARRTCSSAMPR